MKSILRLFMMLAVAILALPVQGLTTLYTAQLDGASESPPNASPGTGFARVNFDPLLHTLDVEATFSGLIGMTTAAHIHGSTPAPFSGTAGVITQLPSFEGFPLGVTSGSYNHTFDTSLATAWNPAFLSSFGGSTSLAEAALESYLMGGTAYFNIHSSAFPAGEIRGFLAPVPEPVTMLLFGAGLLGLSGSLAGKRKN